MSILSAEAIADALAMLAADRGQVVTIASRHPHDLTDLVIRMGCSGGDLGQPAGFGALYAIAIWLLTANSLPIEM